LISHVQGADAAGECQPTKPHGDRSCLEVSWALCREAVVIMIAVVLGCTRQRNMPCTQFGWTCLQALNGARKMWRKQGRLGAPSCVGLALPVKNLPTSGVAVMPPAAQLYKHLNLLRAYRLSEPHASPLLLGFSE
jgi:hypothetical protein